MYCVVPSQCKNFHDFAQKADAHQHPHQEAPSLRRLSGLEQNPSKVSCEPELLQGEFRAAASEILSIMASANAANKAAFVQKRRYQGLPSLQKDAPCPPQ